MTQPKVDKPKTNKEIWLGVKKDAFWENLYGRASWHLSIPLSVFGFGTGENVSSMFVGMVISMLEEFDYPKSGGGIRKLESKFYDKDYKQAMLDFADVVEIELSRSEVDIVDLFVKSYREDENKD